NIDPLDKIRIIVEPGETVNLPFGGGTTVVPGGSIPLDEIYQDSTSIMCAPGTSDRGIQEGYHRGNRVMIRTCAVDGLPDVTGGEFGSSILVNSRVSQNIASMISAMKSDGITPEAVDGFRTMRQQQILWNQF